MIMWLRTKVYTGIMVSGFQFFFKHKENKIAIERFSKNLAIPGEGISKQHGRI